MIILINGAPGSEKTKTAERLFELQPQSAWVDGDYMLVVNPQERTNKEMRLRMKNISAAVNNYHEAGYSNIFISFVYMEPQFLSDQINMLSGIDTVLTVALVPDEETLRNRHNQDTYKREGIEYSISINKQIASIKHDEVIDNSQMSIDEVAQKIIQIIKT